MLIKCTKNEYALENFSTIQCHVREEIGETSLTVTDWEK